MLEKNGELRLTEDDREAYNNGLVTSRVQQQWGPITIDELRKMVSSKQVTFTDKE